MNIPSKRGVRSWPRHLAKAAAWLGGQVRRKRCRDVVFLMYHRVTGDTTLELDLPKEVFHAQMRILAASGRVRSFDDALDRLAGPPTHPSPEPWYVLTFDDAFSDFFTVAYPVLTELGLPAILYVPTGFIDDPEVVPLSGSRHGVVGMEPCTWEMLRCLRDSRHITLGSHTHTHRELTRLPDQDVAWEVETAVQRFQEELGIRPRHFAYPRGKWDARCQQIVARYHDSQAVIEGGAAGVATFSARQVPRIGIGRSDGMGWFRAKLDGRLDGEERLKSVLKEMTGAWRRSP